jgi:hypothetical protein
LFRFDFELWNVERTVEQKLKYIFQAFRDRFFNLYTLSVSYFNELGVSQANKTGYILQCAGKTDAASFKVLGTQ